jgi:hypothetical protein
VSDRIAFDRVTGAVGVRTPIVAPINCSAVGFENTDLVNKAKLWDAAAGGSYKELAKGGAHLVAASHARPAAGDTFPKNQRFNAGDTIVWYEPAAGTGPLAVEFVL